VSHTGYLHWTGGTYFVVGEVWNQGTTAKDVYVSITYYDASNAVIESDDVYTLIGVVLGGRKVPFWHALDTGAESVHHYNIELHYTEDPIGKPQGIRILSHNSSVVPYPPTNWLYISGQIKNEGPLNTIAIIITATHYNVFGDVVGVSFTAVPSLDSNQVTDFQLVEEITYRESLYHHYELSAESVQYALVPEFPASIVLSLLMMVTLVAVALNQLRHKRNVETQA